MPQKPENSQIDPYKVLVLWDLAWYWTQVVAFLPVCAETAPTDGGHHGDSQRAKVFLLTEFSIRICQ